jgi:hypothetical protein
MGFLADTIQNSANLLHGIGIATPELGLTEKAGGVSDGQLVDRKADPRLGMFSDAGTGSFVSGGTKKTSVNNPTNSNTEKRRDNSVIDDKLLDDYSPPARNYTADNIQYIDDQIAQLQQQKNRTSTGLQQGLTNLGDSYNKNVSAQNALRGRAMEDFSTKAEDSARSKDTALDTVNSNARMLSDSLRRRLGLSGGSDSSAYQITAPGAVARDASANRTGVLEDFGTNSRNLDTAQKRAETDFESLLRDLSEQRRTSERGLRAGIFDQQNQIDANIADALRQKSGIQGGGYKEAKIASSPYVAGIESRNSQIDNLFNQFRNPYTIKGVDVQKPNLLNYLTDREAIQTNEQNNTEDPYAPYSPTITKQDEEYNY